MKKSIFILVIFINAMASAQTKSILIINGKAHLGNDSVIANSFIGIKDGKLNLVADASKTKVDKARYDEIIDATGQHIYPGFIAPNSTLGLTEIDAVRATRDFAEIGSTLPNIRSLIAYNTDSKIIPTVRSNGILLAQVTPRGGLVSGTSSIVMLDGWNWEDAAYKVDDGIHINWPRLISRKLIDEDNGVYGPYEKNKEYFKQTNELKKLFDDALAYAQTSDKSEKNLRFEAMLGLFDGSKTLFIHSNDVKEMVEAINFVKPYNLHHIAIVGGKDAWMITDLLRQYNISVVVARLHSLPEHPEEDVDAMYKLPARLQKAGVLYCLNNEGDMEAMGTRNLPFIAGTAAAYGISPEQALQAITLSTARILGIDATTGSLQQGKDATLFISSGDALDMRTNNLLFAFIKGRSINLNNEQKDLYLKYKAKYNLK